MTDRLPNAAARLVRAAAVVALGWSSLAISVYKGIQPGKSTRDDVSATFGALGLFGMLKLLMHAYSLGGGTYTGIEAVSNGVGLMREPRVVTAKRTMLLMASSLAITASGLLLGYLLWHAEPVPGKTMNAYMTTSFETLPPV